jgi:hypothetical protein
MASEEQSRPAKFANQTPHQPDVAPAPYRERGRNYRVGAFVLTAAAVVGAGIYISQETQTKKATPPKVTLSTPPRSTTPERTTTTTIAPNYDASSSFAGLTCEPEIHTIAPGDTIYGLSTVGFNNSDPSFKNTVYEWNLDYVDQQAKTNRALADLNDLQPGTKVKIMGSCVSYSPIFDEYVPNPKDGGQTADVVKARMLVFQNYDGRDGKVHHGTQVWYDENDGRADKVIYCEPDPSCFSYIYGAPAESSANGYY